MAEVYRNLVIVVIVVMEGVDRAVKWYKFAADQGVIQDYVYGHMWANIAIVS